MKPPEDRDAIPSGARRPFVHAGVGAVGLAACSATAHAHEVGHGGVGHGEAAAAFLVVLGLPTLAGLAGGVAAVRYGGSRGSGRPPRGSSVAVGLLLVGLGVASLLPAVAGDRWLSVAGGTIGAAVVLSVATDEKTPGTGCGNHAELALGAVASHRLLEGLVLGALYSAGAAVGVLGAALIAGHAALETAAVGGLYVNAPRRTSAAGAIVLVQVGYVVGAVAGFGVADAVPAGVRTLALAVVGGALVAAGAGETERSVAARRSALVG